MLLCAPVSSGVSLAEEKTWTKRIVQEETPKAVCSFEPEIPSTLGKRILE